ncbi:MAG: tetratricopeptide repeat protein [Lentimicrobiaceae bacterium]|nr:tetratricopeptide repeat protein [Lentimicrobiaceae bacterium]
MTLREVENLYKQIIHGLAGGSVKDALDDLLRLILLTQQSELRIQYEKNLEIYRNILKYTAEGISDPDRPRIFDKMLSSVFDLTDRVYQHFLTHGSGMQIYQIKKELENKLDWMIDEATASVKKLNFETDLDELLEDINLLQTGPVQRQEERSRIMARIFELIWLTDRFNENEMNLVQAIRNSDEVAWYEKCVVVSALTLSLIRCFDQNKMELLFVFYKDGTDQIWHRALVGLFFGLVIYDSRLKFYPAIQKRLSFLNDHEEFIAELRMMIIQVLRSCETDRITKKLQEEILPEVVRLAPKLEEKLDLDNLINRDPSDEKNPAWEEFFKDTPDLYQKMEEFTHLQLEGSDVFWSAFAMLKHFDFFRHVHHWLLPFYTENQAIQSLINEEFKGKDPDRFFNGIARTAYLCNSDKYSFCLNIRHLPEAQKSLLLNYFVEELNNLNEITEEDAMLDKSTHDKFIFTQYIQDLYRFHKLHPLKNELTDIFNIPFSLHDTWFLPLLDESNSIIRNIAEFYFEREQFSQANEIYQILNSKGDNSYEIFEKIGYCFQQTGQYEKALDYYLKAELFDTNKIWLYKKIALCYRRLKKYDDALRFYQELLKLLPDNTAILASIGHCYLDNNDIDQALNYFYRIEFQNSDDISAMRPIAWIYLLKGDFDAAAEYYQQIIRNNPNKYDFMNLGHVEWCRGDRLAAIGHYKLSVRMKDNSLEQFLAGFRADQTILLKHGVPSSDIPLMLDYLKYALDTAS